MTAVEPSVRGRIPGWVWITAAAVMICAALGVVAAIAYFFPVQQILSTPGRDMHPQWSPDGTRIAFYSDRDGGHAIYVAAAWGGPTLLLTPNPNVDSYPHWGP